MDNWGRVDVNRVNDPAAVIAALTGTWQLSGYAVESAQIGTAAWLFRATSVLGETGAALCLLGPDIPQPPPQPFWLDSFTDADGTNVTTHVSEIGNTYLKFPSSTGGATIQSNMVQADVGGGASFFAVCQDLPVDGNYALPLEIKVAGPVGVSDYASMHGRLTPGSVVGLWNGYEARAEAGAISLYRNTDGLAQQLGTVPWTPADGILMLVCKKSTIAVQWNSAEVLSVTDTTYPTGRVGFAIDGQGFKIEHASGQAA